MTLDPFIVAGGGLAGLSAAIELARSGCAVELHEQARNLGGRAVTQNESGFLMNLGPHALYRGGPAMRALTEWRVPFSGHAPRISSGGCVVAGGRKHAFPATTAELLKTSAFRLTEKFAAGAAAYQLTTAKPETARGMSAREWIDARTSTPAARDYCAGLIRLSTYAADLDALSAEAALGQVQMAVREGVLYVDSGWQSLIDGLRNAAVAAGVRIMTESEVREASSGTVVVNGETRRPAGTILAVPPGAVEKLTGRRLGPLQPARAARLDVGLGSLPAGANTFALGLDEPMYFSAHSEVARLAPEGSSLVHVAQYLRAGEKAEREKLEAFADVAMPGWRDLVVTSRYLPSMTVSHAIPTAGGRPDVDALEMEGIMVAGDWVGPEGMLADAAMASGRRAAARLSARRANAA